MEEPAQGPGLGEGDGAKRQVGSLTSNRGRERPRTRGGRPAMSHRSARAGVPGGLGSAVRVTRPSPDLLGLAVQK